MNCRDAKELIDLLIASGADINAKSGSFSLTPLQQAVWGGRMEAVKALLAHKPDVNAVNSDNQTALHYAIPVHMGAVFRGSTINAGKEIMELLLANGADINHGYPILLHAGQCANNAGLMEFLLAKGANVNAQEPGGDTALNMAVRAGNKEVVQLMLRHNPDLKLKLPGGHYATALATALAEGRLDFALLIQEHVLQSRSNSVAFAAALGTADALRSLLLKTPESVGEPDALGLTPLHCAAAAGRKDTSEILLAAGANVNAPDAIGLHPLEWAALAGRLPVVELLVETGANDTSAALFLAAQAGQNPVAQFLLEHGASPNAHGEGLVRALHIAAQQGNLGLARLLLQHGAGVNPLDHNYSTPLDFAVDRTSKDMVELLFAHGAVVPMTRPGCLTIFQEWALGSGDTNIAEVLLSQHADVNATDRRGQTPLHFAAGQGQLQAVEWLLKHGAKVNARNGDGKTPLGILHAQRGGFSRRDVAAVLQKCGAKE